MNRSDVLNALIRIGGPVTDQFTKATFALGKTNLRTAEALSAAAKALQFSSKYQAKVDEWLAELAPTKPAPTPAPQPVPVPTSDPVVPSPVPQPEPIPTPTPVPEVGPEKWETKAVQDGDVIVASFQAPAGFKGQALIDLEVFAPGGAQVHQFFADQDFADQHEGVKWTVAVPALPEGTYTVRLGVFAPGWAKQYDWNNEGGTYVVGAAQPAPAPVEPAPEPKPEPAPTPAPEQPSEAEFYVDGGTAAQEADELERLGRKDEAQMIRDAVASKPQAVWWNGGDVSHIRQVCAAAKAQGKRIALVAYNIPDRDAGNWSRGGAANVEDYKRQFDQFVAAIGFTPAYVDIEPDATNLPDVLSADRKACLNYAMKALSKVSNVRAYIDAGHSNWRSVDEMAARLNSLEIPDNVGISLNVSSWQSTASSIDYGKKLTPKLKGSSKRMVIDTSRNGMEQWPVYVWANNRDSKSGTTATTKTGDPAVDAFLHVKRPGESDGEEVPAGQWHREWAIGFAKRSLGK